MLRSWMFNVSLKTRRRSLCNELLFPQNALKIKVSSLRHESIIREYVAVVLQQKTRKKHIWKWPCPPFVSKRTVDSMAVPEWTKFVFMHPLSLKLSRYRSEVCSQPLDPLKVINKAQPIMKTFSRSFVQQARKALSFPFLGLGLIVLAW